MDQVQIGKFISELRKEKGLTQEQLGERLGVTQKTVSRWENGRNMPDIAMLPILCEELDINIAELMNGASGLAHLERGIFGKYRILNTWDTNDPLAGVTIVTAGGDQTDSAEAVDEAYPECLFSYEYDGRPLLKVIGLDDTTVVDIFGRSIRYYGENGDRYTIRQLAESFNASGSESSSSTGVAETNMIYVLELIVLAIGVIFIRYFMK